MCIIPCPAEREMTACLANFSFLSPRLRKKLAPACRQSQAQHPEAFFLGKRILTVLEIATAHFNALADSYRITPRHSPEMQHTNQSLETTATRGLKIRGDVLVAFGVATVLGAPPVHGGFLIEPEGLNRVTFGPTSPPS